ncbi:MAG: cation transporter [Bacilli bacterium]|nr:cation transporter [Bacilli bacterium]
MDRFKVTKKVGILGIIANLFLFIVKIIFGLMSKSQAMIADSFNSIGDVFASLMTAIGNKIASCDSDEDHNFGHGKAEYIFSMFISISILVIGIKLLYDSISMFFRNNQVLFSWNLILVCILTIIIKLSLYIYTKKIYIKEKNILIKSSMIDHRNDTFLTTGVLISTIFAKYGIYYIDYLMGTIISIWFLLSGVKLFKESYNVLMDISLDLETQEKIMKTILKDKNIIKIDDLHSVSIGYKYIVVLTISVDGNLSTFNSHEVANNIEKRITKRFDNVKEVFVHINPI